MKAIKKYAYISTGLLLIIIGLAYIIYTNTNYEDKYVNAATGEIIDVIAIESNESNKKEIRYSPMVKYKIDNKTYITICNTYSKLSNRYKIGNSITIQYNSQNPNEIITKKQNLFIYIFCMISGISILLISIGHLSTKKDYKHEYETTK